MKPLFTLITLVLLLPLLVSAQAATTDWQVVVYADGSNALKVLSSAGVVQSIAAGSLPLHVGTFPNAPLVAITSDRRALAALNFISNQRLTVTIADHGTCCKTVRLADAGVVLANIGSFSPNGRRFAVSYLAVTDEAAHQFESAVVTVDVELGAVISRLENRQIGGDYALLRDWNDDGIDYLPLCYGCDQPPAGSLARWNPDTGDVTSNLSYYDTTQDTLALTGETIAPGHRPDFPLPIQNADSAQNVLTFGDSARVIYYNPNSLQITSAHWVADGWEILIEHPDGVMLLDRAGAKHPINSGDTFLVGTPDGWLGTRAGVSDSIEVVHHTLTNLDGKVIARFYHPITVIQAPALGATATQGGFPNIASPVRAITCPNTLPPRLIAGGKGRVSSGGVNLRRDPSLTSSTIVMITTEVFNVIAGPNCDPTGIAWWEVGLGGLRGWMAESKDGVYLLEPVLH
ncbi:MAG: hypothetical protein GC204_17410 [Chloroflexi bacterium]|nr:hypothetical protein [Chloroflexota bacterium]